MNMSEIAGLVAGLDVEIGDAELAGSDAELLDSLRRERAALVREGLALEENEAEEAFALDRASDRAFSLVFQTDERRALERLEAHPDGLCPAAHGPGPCPRYGPGSDACCRLT